MTNERQNQDPNQSTRVVILVIVAVVAVFVVRALFSDGADSGLGWGDVLYFLGGLA